MIRRVMGLLILLALLFPPVAVAAGALIVRDVVNGLNAVVEDRLDGIRAELTDIEETVEDARAELAGLVSPINGVLNALQDLIDDVGDFSTSLTIPGVVLADFVLGIPGIGSFTIIIPNIPSTTLSIPGLSGLRGLVEDALNEVSELASAVSTIARLRFIPTQINQAAAAVRALVTDVTSVWSAQSGPVQALALACGVWLIVVYVAVAYLGFRTGWKLLTGP